MENEEYQVLYRFIENKTGIRVNPSHKIYLDSWIESNLNQFKYSVAQYLALVERDESECSALIDEAAINETYFFREELHFSYLQDMIFPKLQGCPVTIWSAASSTGEEALSLYALADDCGVNATIIASDIDQNALSILRKGEYHGHSFRRNENHYLHLLEKLGTYTDVDEKSLFVSPEVLSHIQVCTHNLISDDALPVKDESVDIIFLRNVFIYFSSQNQLKVLQKLSSALKPGGLLFLSINEIAAIECPDTLPLVKEHFQTVYYLRKVTAEEKENARRIVRAERKRNEDVLPHISPIQKCIPEIPPVQIPSAEKNISEPPSIQELWVYITQLIQKNQYGQALNEVRSYHFKANQLEFQYYYLGMIAFQSGQLEEASEDFARATAANPKFWPAFFQRGLVCQKLQNDRAEEESFRHCRELLRLPEIASSTAYGFLTEDFNPAYFVNLCDSFLGC